MNTQNRYGKFVSMGQYDQSMMQSMSQGAILLKHPNNHCFRDRKQELENDPMGGIYLKTQTLGKIRAEQEQKTFKEGHLDPDYFEQDKPGISIKKWLRIREIAHEGPDFRFGLKHRTENENIQQNILENNILIEHTARDMKMAHFPQWKHDQKDRWRTNSVGQVKDFDTACNIFCDENQAWEQKPFVLNGVSEKYIDGLEAVGNDQTMRKRDKEKEMKRPDFVPYVKGDTWEDTLKTSKSIRTFMADKAYQSPNDIDLFSTNNRLSSTYKKTLLETKSIDRLVPFKHSQNVNGFPMNDLRPTNDKLYKLSLKHYSMGGSHQGYIPNLALNSKRDHLIDDFPSASPIQSQRLHENPFEKSIKSSGTPTQEQQQQQQKQQQKQQQPQQQTMLIQDDYVKNEFYQTNKTQSTSQSYPIKASQSLSNKPKWSNSPEIIPEKVEKTQGSLASLPSPTLPQQQQQQNESQTQIDTNYKVKQPHYRKQKSEKKLRLTGSGQLPPLKHSVTTRNFLPWEQPNSQEIQGIVGKYFSSQYTQQKKPKYSKSIRQNNSSLYTNSSGQNQQQSQQQQQLS